MAQVVKLWLEWLLAGNKAHGVVFQEMVLQMAMGGGATHKPAPAIPRLGISAYQYDTECLHGIMTLDTTAFPQSLGLSASFRFVCAFVFFLSRQDLNRMHSTAL